jgi:hypothetical protein
VTKKSSKNLLEQANVSQSLDAKAQGTLPDLDAEARNLNDARKEPTTESIQRYKDAVEKALDRDYLEFISSTTTGSWKYWAHVGYLEKQLRLCEEQASAARAEVYQAFGKTVDPDHWNIFLNGTAAQGKALQDAIAWEMHGEDPNEAALEHSISVTPEVDAQGTPEGLDAEAPKLGHPAFLSQRGRNL